MVRPTYSKVEKIDLCKIMDEVESTARMVKDAVLSDNKGRARSCYDYIYTLLNDIHKVI